MGKKKQPALTERERVIMAGVPAEVYDFYDRHERAWLARRPATFTPGKAWEWRRYGTLSRDQEMPALPGQEDDAL